jgi:non-specific serine/threonine protein kinase
MLEVRLLGQFSVQLDGAPVAIPSRPAQSLLAYLVLNAGTPQRRERLAGLLWPEAAEPNARRSLRQALWHVRRAITANGSSRPPYILADELSITFDSASDYWLDVAVLSERVAESASVEALVRAISVYRGELLPGFYQEWVVSERERLQAVFEQKMNTLLDRLIEAGRWPEVLEWGERWITHCRSPEPAYRALMLAHHGLGDRAGVAAVFQRCAAALRDDLGVEPSGQTRALYETLVASGGAPPDSLAPASFQSRYRFESEIGRGGMSVVYRAHDTLLDRAVAIKALSASGLGEEGRARWLREARAAARLNHPNVVPVYDVGEATPPAATMPAPCIVMELVEGHSLHDYRPGSLAEVIAIFRQICAALEHAHAHHIIHRDLKPENVIIAPDGAAKLMDFGLARTPASRLTITGGIAGTVFYLAPELLRGQDPSPQSDLYALGVMLYELAAGRLPFTGDDPLAVISHHLHTPPTPPREHDPALPPALDALILRLLSKQPADRPASAAEVRQALDEVERQTTGAGAPPQRAGAAPPPASGLPAQPTPFVGRQRELAEVAERLQSPACRLLTLIGPGGIGKTRLALQAAAAHAPAFADGVCFVPLAPISSSDFLLSAIAESLKFTFYGGQDARVQLLNYLRDKQSLLVLDNFEHLLDGAGLIAEMLASAPGLKFLVTSQERLNLQGEWLLEVQGMRVPSSEAEEGLETYGAIQLFVQSARRVDAGFGLSKEDLPAVIRICRMVAGMPLGIELAAAWVRSLSCAEIAREIERNLGFLTTTLRDVPERHRSLLAVFDYAWNRFSEEERDVFQRLSVFWGGFQREAAGQVAGATLAQLSALVDKSLLRRSASGRYEMHGLLRQYAQKRLVESGEAEAVRGRHLDFYLRLAEEAEPGLRAADQIAWLARLEAEHDNLRAALKWALDGGGIEAGLRLAGALARFWYLRGYWAEGRDWLQRLLSQREAEGMAALEAAAHLRRARAKALYGAAWLANEDASEQGLYEEALALSRAVGDKWSVAFALRGLAARANYDGEHARAAAYLNESLALFRELGDDWGEALVSFNQGWVAHDQGEYEEAAERWDDSLKLFREVGDRWGAAVSLGSLGYLARLMNDYPLAAKDSEESLALFRELGDKAGIATSLSRLASVAFRRGEFQQAVGLLEDSRALQHELGSTWGVAFTLSFVGMVACYQGDYRRAEAALQEGLKYAREVVDEDTEDFAVILDYLGFLAYHQGDLNRARTLWEETLAGHRRRGDKMGVPFALMGLGLVAHRQGDQERASEYLEESQALWRHVKDKRYVAIALHGLGQAALAQGDEARAAARFREGMSLRKEIGDKQGLAESLEGWAALHATKHPDKAARLFGAAEALREMIGAPVPPVERADYERGVAAVRARLDEAAFAAAWAEGRETTLKDIIAGV